MDIISDKHWLIENVICLLSNAVKYSNGGAVKILVEHVQSVKHDVQDEETKNENENLASATNDSRGIGMKPITLPSLQLLPVIISRVTTSVLTDYSRCYAHHS